MTYRFKVSNINGFFPVGLFFASFAIGAGSWMLGLASVPLMAIGFIGAKFERLDRSAQGGE